jgi:peptidoglycan/xylan/chitin deacetylase (PgdA/CDA1 family)
MKSSLVLLFVTFNCWSAEIAITIDDPKVSSAPLFSAEARDREILTHLNTAKVKATLFVTGTRIDNLEGKKLLDRWDNDGHSLSNHSYSHQYFHSSKIDLDAYKESFQQGHALIKDYKSFVPRYRYPYLKAGNTLEKRNGFRLHLKENNYQFGYVTVDASDWYISERLERRLRKGEQVELDAYKNYYLEHIWDRAVYYDNLSKKVLGHSPKHTLLIHHNLLNALFLDDLIAMFRTKGWKVINSEEAFKDPVYQSAPNVVPAGESIIWSLAKAQKLEGLRYPAEDGKYQAQGLDELSP